MLNDIWFFTTLFFGTLSVGLIIGLFVIRYQKRKVKK
jgi:uncharacterized membrane-anchored protein YhcB (DUF1043 family)